MSIQKITAYEFINLAINYPIIDVRSPSEYDYAHIPNAYNLPLFNNDERKIVGTAYKQQSKQIAIKIGLEFFGVKMRKMVEDVEAIINSLKDKNTNTILVHCWRGGMRSAGVAWLLDLYGYTVYTLIGGYKAYRKVVLAQFEKDYPLKIIGGYTGSGKSDILQQLQLQNHTVLDLESLANHKGSAFGGIGMNPQPSQEMFENLLAKNLQFLEQKTPNEIFCEDESQRIGNLQIPMPLWNTMRKCSVYFLEIPFQERVKYIVKQYGTLDKPQLATAIMRIQKKLGGLETKTAINYLLENNMFDCFTILLKYYDKWYTKALYNRQNTENLIRTIACQNCDAIINTQKILNGK